MNINEIAGKGLSFPINLTNGSAEPETGWNLIKSCIFNLLVHEYGKRYFQRDFGCNLYSSLQEPNDDITARQIEHRLSEQLETWENRVYLVGNVEVTRSQNDSRMNIKLKVALSNTNPVQTETFEFIL